MVEERKNTSQFLFWTEWGQSPTISRSRLDGSEQSVLVSTGLARPNGISIDYQENKLYWCDARNNKIERINLERGEQREIVFSSSGVDMFSIAVFGAYLFWSDRAYANGSIRRASKKDAVDVVTIRSGLGVSLKDVKVFNQDREKGTNACSKANGGCQQLCFYLGNNRKQCACAHGYLAQDGLRCNRYEGYLLYSERTVLRSIHLSDENNLNSPIRAYENPNYFKNVIALAFDHRQKVHGTNRIFFSDVHYGNIQVISDDWTGRRVIAETSPNQSQFKARRLLGSMTFTQTSLVFTSAGD
ncbi:Low-density lipoprotein receptor-related protein 1B [Labeo rohita]|uniref:Low-density lipoprotein receptor-related protein 1B n=1 Tax=Labeo rohita TaxID=84645 RepID=A0ABQ8LLF2_LABRO|nr:Low-density lipoprotein receptor-related protein 1B [Labeo rohita]